jgi:polyribonucleotide nucleotidyltransferase
VPAPELEYCHADGYQDRGITKDIMRIALRKHRKARFQILDIMAECLAEPRTELAR